MKRVRLIFGSILFMGIVTSYAGDDYAKFNGWAFRNWEQDPVYRNVFQQAFIGVSSDDPMNGILYDEIYSKYATGGQCFGMSLLSVTILKEEGHLGFCKPIYIYSGDNTKPYTGPTDSLLRKAIMVMHAHQFGHASVNWLLEAFKGEEFSNGKFAWEQADYYLSMGDPPLISIIQGIDDGHTMVPYRCDKIGSSEWRIYVYDPNRPYKTDSAYYAGDSNYIKVKAIPGGYDWSFKTTSGDWSGTTGPPLPEGGIFIIPSSLVKPASRNPLALGAVQDEIGTIILRSDGGSVAQIIDGKGRKFYKTDVDAHTKLSEIEDDPNLGMTNAIRWVNFGEAKGNYPEVYFIKGISGKDLKIDVASKGKDYKFLLAGRDNVVKVEATSGPFGRDELELQRVGTRHQELKINSKRGAATYSVELYRMIPITEAARTFKISNLKVTKTSPVRLRLTGNRDALLIKSEKGPVVCDMEIIQTVGGKISKLEKKNINVSGVKWQKVAPTNWTNLKDAKLELKEIEFKKVTERNK